MCGICGILRVGPSAGEIDPLLIDRMTESLVHRGPDDRGVWQDDRIALGHRRLSVIDLSPNGRQPMGNEDGSIQIVYNGEVYNFQELKKRFRLVEKGHVFRSRTDTEVLIHLYEEIGLEMVRELNGMFALAIWNANDQLLHLIRDRYGIKPLFYQRDEQFFRFGSEIKAILRNDRVRRKPSLQALHDFLTFDYIPGAQTAFEDILEVPPAQWMTIHPAGNVTSNQYWDLPFDVDTSMDEETVTKQTLELLDRSVKRRLIADVPVGVLLSGGLDSSAVVAVMKQSTSDPFHTYSVGFEDPSFSELPYARTVAKRFGTIHHEVTVTPQMVRDLLPGYLKFIDEPYADGSAIPTYYVCQRAKEDVVVLLSGEGADEAFAGYETYVAYQVARYARHVPRWLRHNVLLPLVNRLPASDKRLSLDFRMKRFLGGLDLPPPEAHLWWRIVLTEAEKLELYTPEVLEQLTPEPSDRHFVEAFERLARGDVLSRLLYIDSRVFLPDDLMIKNDRMSMAHSLETRLPMTDPELTEFMSKVPSHFKLRGLRKKYALYRAMEGRLPKSTLRRKKLGLEMPYSRWFKGELRDFLVDHLSPERLTATGIFRPEPVQRLIDDHMAERVDNGRALWGLLNYMMWLELYT